MKRHLLLGILFIFLIVLTACTEKGDGGTTPDFNLALEPSGDTLYADDLTLPVETKTY